MKKIILFTLAAGLIASCNSGGENTGDTVKDSTVKAIDSLGDARMDSLEQATDSLKEKTEKTFEKTDSANRALADSAAKNK